MSSEPQIRYTKTSDGVSIAYATLGQGAPLVVTPFHGFSHVGMELENPAQRTILDRLATSLRLTRYDRRSTGLSQRRVGFDADTEQRDLEAVVNAVTDEPFVLLGRGFAGAAAIRYAAQHPDRVSRLILYDTAISTKQISGEPLNAAHLAVAAALRHDRASMSRILNQMTFGGPEPDWFEAFEAASLDPDHWDYDLRNDASDVACDVTAPVLVIAERFPDQNIERSTDLCARFPDAELVVIDRWKGDPWPDWIDIADHVYRFLDLDPPPAPASKTHVAAPTRTILFTDIVGHTEMMQRLGDAKGRDVLREHERITRETLKAHGGAEVKTMGDGFMASFGSVTSAMECAIALQRAFATHTESMPEPLHVRVGLNAGEPIEEDGDLFGATVILASRIAAKAGAGEILVPDTVRGLLSGKGFMFSDRGEFVPKGFDEGVRLWDVRWRED